MYEQADIGLAGEDLACTFLREKGYDILHRNWRFKRAEIDLIARKNNTIIFVEVKTRTSSNFGPPEAFLSEAQSLRVWDAADAYLQETQNLVGQHRFDLIAIEYEAKNRYRIKHFEDIFV